MTGEEAYYYKILLQYGFTDDYDRWLNTALEGEDPLSNIVLELSLCGSDVEKTLSCLTNYCKDNLFDDNVVGNKLRLFLKDGYYSGRFTKDEVVSHMYNFAKTDGYPFDYESSRWRDMYYMLDYFCMADDGIVPAEEFDKVFHDVLNKDFLTNGAILIDPWSNIKKDNDSSKA